MAILHLLILASARPAIDANYEASIKEFRAKREKSLKGDRGWLSVAGLVWLAPGPNRISISEVDRISSAPNPSGGTYITFPGGLAPLTLGTLNLEDGEVSFAPGQMVVKINGRQGSAQKVATDADEKPDLFTCGRVSFRVIKRGARFGLRVWDPKNSRKAAFKGLQWYPIDAKWDIKAKWVAYEQPKKVIITDIIGDNEEATVPGYAEFQVAGQTVKLQAVLEGDNYFFNFRDATSGKETYHAGRFLDANGPKDGVIELDFNKCYTPPCGFTEFATCPLPPRSNRLTVAIPAGEKYVHAH